MLKEEIRSTLEAMTTDDRVDFFCNGGQVDQITKTMPGFRVFSMGNGWSDQAPEHFSFSVTLKMLWNNKPHSAIWK